MEGPIIVTDVNNTPQPDETDDRSVPEASADPDVTFDSVGEAFAAFTDGPDAVDETAPPQYGVGPFSIREAALGGAWVIAFIVSFFPIYSVGSSSVWTAGIDWVLTIGVPTVAVFLLLLRRLSPQGIRRVGSLGIDQFASVAFTVSMVVWLGILWASFVSLAGQRLFYATWVVWVEFILMLAGVLLTVFAPLFPTIGDDFRYRPEVPAHRVASPARPIVARPQAPRPVHTAPAASAAPAAETAAPVGLSSADASPAADTTQIVPLDTVAAGVVVAGDEPVEQVEQDLDTQSAPAASQAFWALAPVERDVVDESGATIFTIGPTAWALVIEDRGDSFVVRHEDGRIGYLTDVSGVTRG
ncbi:MAG TPA: hypothetical protein PLN62_05145 [Microbacterium sp.]|nr:hypothetical protein [Microbacterium sp.]